MGGYSLLRVKSGLVSWVRLPRYMDQPRTLSRTDLCWNTHGGKDWKEQGVFWVCGSFFLFGLFKASHSSFVFILSSFLFPFLFARWIHAVCMPASKDNTSLSLQLYGLEWSPCHRPIRAGAGTRRSCEAWSWRCHHQIVSDLRWSVVLICSR